MESGPRKDEEGVSQSSVMLKGIVVAGNWDRRGRGVLCDIVDCRWKGDSITDSTQILMCENEKVGSAMSEGQEEAVMSETSERGALDFRWVIIASHVLEEDTFRLSQWDLFHGWQIT